ncbi:phosphopantetheine-binding protein [Streptomyces europaeiscabiei]|uniref:phosphopantetheine-binding protein n=1 Tax=Streptomyces europaeiscabiei TaxID=146819 RepID=UPI002E2B0B7B|nr:phosphopantetheine-binding protein [Streptomyces europaeiscabiei]
MTDNEFRNPMDALVVSSVRTLLDNTSVNIDDNFLDVGGNSIVAIRLGQILSEKLGIPRTVRIIFKNPVLRDLSDALSDLAGEKV